MAIKWATAPYTDDVEDAAHYLTLVGAQVEDWTKLSVSTYYAKDIIRASALTPLSKENAGVRKYLDRIKKGDVIAPVLLISGQLSSGIPLIIAEGWHRVCACYSLDERTLVTCRLAPNLAMKPITRIGMIRADGL